MTILVAKNKPENHIIEETWLDTVLTTYDTGEPGTKGVLVDSDESTGKISNGWLYVTDHKITSTTSTNQYYPDKPDCLVLVKFGKTIDHSLLNLYSDLDTPIVNLDSTGKIPSSLIQGATTGGNSDKFVRTNDQGKIDYSFLNTTSDILADTIVKTDSDGYLNRNLLDITRIVRVLKSAVAANANYTINNTSQNANYNTSETLKIPTNRKDLYVFHNGMLLLENTDFSVSSSGTFTFTNGLSAGDVLQIIAMN